MVKVDKMGLGKMDQTWVPSMPPLLSPNLKVFGLETWHCALTREKTLLKRKTGKNLKGNFGVEALHKNKILKIYKCYNGLPNDRHSS